MPIDLIYFTNLTPLPGSEDHQKMVRRGEWIDPDLNKFDLNHRVTHHGRMPDAEWDQAYEDAWNRFYTFEHMETILRRMVAFGSNMRFTTVYRLLWYRDFRKLYKCHPLEGGFLRIKRRKDRRPSHQVENPLVFYPRYWLGEIRNIAVMSIHYLRLRRMMLRIWNDPQRMAYRDPAMLAADADEAMRALYTETRGGREQVEKQQRQRQIIAEALNAAGDSRSGRAAAE